MTCVPASSVPISPTSAHFHASGPRLTRNSETICWLPGGKRSVRSMIRSNMFVRRPMGLVATPTRISSEGKKARKRLYATACATMLVRGKTRPNTPKARFARAADAIMVRHYTYAGCSTPETTCWRGEDGHGVPCPYNAKLLRRMTGVEIGLDRTYLL